jgi:hypothetical protein
VVGLERLARRPWAVKSRALFKKRDQFVFLDGLGMSLDLPDEPEEALGCGVLARLELVAD